jgi:hypothetical protein
LKSQLEEILCHQEKIIERTHVDVSVLHAKEIAE